MSRRSHKDRFTQFITISLIAHIGFIGTSIITGALNHSPPTIPKSMQTKLVKLGKKRDPKLMPRLDTGPQVSDAPQKQKAPEPKKEPVKEPPKATPKKVEPAHSKKPVQKTDHKTKQEKPPVETKAERAKTAQDVLKERLGKFQEDEGDPNGSSLGRDLDGQLRASYNTKIIALVQQSLTAPQTLTQSERIRLKSVVFFQVNPDGSISNLAIRQTSGNEAFDNTVLAAVKKAAPFPPPPFTARGFYQGGVGINVCPIRCR